MQRWKLVAVIGAVAAAVIASLIVLLVASTREQPPVAPPGPPTGPRVSAPETDPSAVPTAIDENEASGEDQAAQVKVCNSYLDAFLQPGRPEERAGRLREWGTPQNVEQAKVADRLPSAKRQGDCAIDASTSRPNMSQAHVQLTDGSWWAATLVKDPTAAAQWRVHALTKEGH